MAIGESGGVLDCELDDCRRGMTAGGGPTTGGPASGRTEGGGGIGGGGSLVKSLEECLLPPVAAPGKKRK